MRATSPRREECACEDRSVPGKEIAPGSPRNPRFRVGDVVRTVGGGGAYNRGEIVEVAEEDYYRVNYGMGFPSLIREENLEPFDEKDPLSEPPRSYVPPLLPFM